MVVIRLSRSGAKKRPFYHLIVTDSRRRRDCGNYIDRIGFYNPIACGQEIPLHIEMEKVLHWEKLGAKISDRVRSLIKQYNKKDKAA